MLMLVGYIFEVFVDFLLEKVVVVVVLVNGFGKNGEGYVWIGFLIELVCLVEVVEWIGNLYLFD